MFWADLPVPCRPILPICSIVHTTGRALPRTLFHRLLRAQRNLARLAGKPCRVVLLFLAGQAGLHRPWLGCQGNARATFSPLHFHQ
ncbi:hypothetical protein GQ53DRAFT_334361 [Thozetella sp. PMI_491]|nr:hypothetical protein GQ53DRAFT_334361 [Thozetella sp. PMI_491]